MEHRKRNIHTKSGILPFCVELQRRCTQNRDLQLGAKYCWQSNVNDRNRMTKPEAGKPHLSCFAWKYALQLPENLILCLEMLLSLLLCSFSSLPFWAVDFLSYHLYQSLVFKTYCCSDQVERWGSICESHVLSRKGQLEPHNTNSIAILQREFCWLQGKVTFPLSKETGLEEMRKTRKKLGMLLGWIAGFRKLFCPYQRKSCQILKEVE